MNKDGPRDSRGDKAMDRINLALEAPSRVREIVFLGTGTSSCTPVIGCLMTEHPSCNVCQLAAAGGKNRRLNVSAVIRWEDAEGRLRSLLIDCGKSFYTAARRWAVPLRLGAWEAVLLTHGHADAMLGLDDLRHWTGHGSIQEAVDIWADRETQAVVASTFPYLVDQGKATGGGFVSTLRFHGMEAGVPLAFHGLDVLPVEVEHGVHSDGRPYMCLAFLIDGGRIAYFSDVSAIPEGVMRRLVATPPEIFVLDCLREHRPYRSHFVLKDCLEAVRRIRPRRTFLVGLAHDVEHEDLARRLKDLIPEYQVEPAFDGLVLQLH